MYTKHLLCHCDVCQTGTVHCAVLRSWLPLRMDPPVALFGVYGYVRVVERIRVVILYAHISGRFNVVI